jgi:sugar phosphate isomerase/epimerase
LYIGGSSQQTVSREITKRVPAGRGPKFDGQLGNDELRQVRLKLDEAGVRLLTYRINAMPSDEAGCRKVFEFGRKIGIETVIAEPPLASASLDASRGSRPDVLDTIERLCDEYDINLAVSSRGENTSQNGGHPQQLLTLCNGRSRRIGVCGDLAFWLRCGIDPIEGAAMLRDRLIILQVPNLDELHSTNAGKIGPLLEEIHRLDLKPTMFSVEYMQEKSGSMPGIVQSIDLFNKVSVQLAKRGEP